MINGTTLHSHLAIGLAKDTPAKLAFMARKFPGVAERIFNMDALLIDEVRSLTRTVFGCAHVVSRRFPC